MQNLKEKLLQAGLIPQNYRPGETPEQRSARMNKEQAEKRSKIAQLVKSAHLELPMGENLFFFTTRSKKMRRLLLEAEAKSALEKGLYAVVDWPDRPDFPWAVVPRKCAEAILAIDPGAVRFYIRSEAEQLGVAPEAGNGKP